jgi:hypothetical protein
MPIGPQNGTSGISYTYYTNTTDPDGDDVRYGWDWNGDDYIDEWTDYKESGNDVILSHTWNFSGIYYIKVKAEDTYGALSDFSPGKKIMIVNINNDPPNKPTCPFGPTSGKEGISYSFSSVATDPNGDNIHYLFDWDDGTISDWNGPFKSGQVANVSHIWENKGSYQIKVKVKDVHGEESVWSDPLSISMPKNKSFNSFNTWILRLIQRFPFLDFLFI